MPLFPRAARFLTLMAGLTAVSICPCRAQQSQPAGFYQSPGTKKMAELLRKIYRESDWKSDPNKPAERAVYYKFLLTKDLNPNDEVLARKTLASELLRAGDSEGAVNALLELRKVCAQKGIKLPPEARA